MKKKRLIAIFSIFTALVLVVVLGSAIFTVQSIAVIYKTEFNSQIEQPDNVTFNMGDIKGLKKNSSIFFMSESKLIEQTQSSNPLIKIIGVERVFPNKVNVYFTNRIPIAVVESNKKYYTVDLEGFVIDIVTSIDGYILIDGANFEFRSSATQDVVVGDYLFSNKNQGQLDMIFASLKAVWQKVDGTVEIKSVVRQVGYSNDELNIYTRAGCVIVIEQPSKNLTNKVLKAYDVLSYIGSRPSGVVITAKEVDGKVTIVTR